MSINKTLVKLHAAGDSVSNRKGCHAQGFTESRTEAGGHAASQQLRGWRDLHIAQLGDLPSSLIAFEKFEH